MKLFHRRIKRAPHGIDINPVNLPFIAKQSSHIVCFLSVFNDPASCSAMMGRTHTIRALIYLQLFVLPKVSSDRVSVTAHAGKCPHSAPMICVLCLCLQLEICSGKVLEETYLKWVQYKQECVRMIKTEPLPQGNRFKLYISRFFFPIKMLITGQWPYKLALLVNRWQISLMVSSFWGWLMQFRFWNALFSLFNFLPFCLCRGLVLQQDVWQLCLLAWHSCRLYGQHFMPFLPALVWQRYRVFSLNFLSLNGVDVSFFVSVKEFIPLSVVTRTPQSKCNKSYPWRLVKLCWTYVTQRKHPNLTVSIPNK